MRLNIKPLSVNQAWQGRRYKTKDYKAFEQEALIKLKPLVIPDGLLRIDLEFGFSNPSSDWDNGIKPFIDILQKAYGFDDKRIYLARVTKAIVDKGKEYIEFEISEY